MRTVYRSRVPHETKHKEADRLREAGQLDAAIALYTEAIAVKATDERTFNNRGLCFMLQGDLDKAISDFTEAIRLAPYVSFAYGNRAVAYERLGEQDKSDADARAGARVRQQYEGQ